MGESPAPAALDAGCARDEGGCSATAAVPRDPAKEALPIGDFVGVAHSGEIATAKTVGVGGTPAALFNVRGSHHTIFGICPLDRREAGPPAPGAGGGLSAACRATKEAVV